MKGVVIQKLAISSINLALFHFVLLSFGRKQTQGNWLSAIRWIGATFKYFNTTAVTVFMYFITTVTIFMHLMTMTITVTTATVLAVVVFSKHKLTLKHIIK